MVEQGTHKPLDVSSNLTLATRYLKGNFAAFTTLCSDSRDYTIGLCIVPWF
jgi:hypothetical protein